MTPRQRPSRHAASRPPASGARYPAAACTTIRWLRHRQRRPPPAGRLLRCYPMALCREQRGSTARTAPGHPVAGWAGVNGQCQPTVRHQTGARIGDPPLADAGGRPPPTARSVFGVARRLTRRNRRYERVGGRRRLAAESTRWIVMSPSRDRERPGGHREDAAAAATGRVGGLRGGASAVFSANAALRQS